MSGESNLDFQLRLREILETPGVTQKCLAGWAEVDPSTVTRWHQGSAVPHDPVGILQKLRPHVDRVREDISSLRRNEVDSWRNLIGDMDPGLRDHIESTGLLATSYFAVASWIPTSLQAKEYDVVIVRYFDGIWADMGRRVYNIGDQSQTVALSEEDDATPQFDQYTSLSDLAVIKIKADKEVGKSVARLHIQLGLEHLPYRNDAIGFVEGFGYRYRATKAIVSGPVYQGQTNDFLGATIPIACRRFHLIICIPKTCFRGSPSALSSSNRSMLRVLLELDNADTETIESLLWPYGQVYEMSSAPDAPLKVVPRVGTMIDKFPQGLQDALKALADLDVPDGQSVAEVFHRSDSACFVLDLHNPHPSLTPNIVWRLCDPSSNGQV